MAGPAATLAAIWRHPVKSLGRETVAETALEPGRGLPWDRTWAVAHRAARIDFGAPGWADCENFLIASVSPRMMQVEARWEPEARRLTLTHPDAAPLTADPDEPAGAEAIAAWAGAFAAPGQRGPFRLVRAPVAMHDTDFPSVSVKSLASLGDLAARTGAPADPRRFRGNLWIDGLAPWAERDWIGREIAVGSARLKVVEPVVRCAATETSPETGRRDARTRAALHEVVGAAEFGVYATVVEGGTVRPGDAVTAP